MINLMNSKTPRIPKRPTVNFPPICPRCTCMARDSGDSVVWICNDCLLIFKVTDMK